MSKTPDTAAATATTKAKTAAAKVQADETKKTQDANAGKNPSIPPPASTEPPSEPPAPPAEPEVSVEPSPVPDIPEQGDQSAIDAHERHANALFEQGVEEAKIEAAQQRISDRAVAKEVAAHEAEIKKARLAEEA